MDARAALQVDFDTHKIRALIARYLGIDAEQVTNEVHFRNATAKLSAPLRY
jgi:hypothetical protein